MLDPALLAETYGGHVIVLPAGDRTIIDDAHHHDDAAPGEHHFHEGVADVLDFLLDPMAFGFMQRGLIAAILVGIVCAVMGAFVVLRGLAFIGDAVSHAAFPGLVIAFMLGIPLYVGGAIAAVGTALAIGAVARRGALRFDTAVGVLFAGMFAFGIVLFSTIQGYVTDLFSYLLGNVLGITTADIIQIAVLGGIVLLVVARAAQGAAVRLVRSGRRGGVGPAGRDARLPPARAASGSPSSSASRRSGSSWSWPCWSRRPRPASCSSTSSGTWSGSPSRSRSSRP